ncbi:G-type lectin S-receptor-like serine/threonine-protein kinase At1g61500 isoform X2 [Raphanus sativus]|uniref:G-type lectin S-receptor-like serine/threonine-protein kinase At1g61500 isoform X2 n=1 Tax=Raphanus sativus TaxID=3726 RepID=A0A9W3CDR1_RAPSA|nr:G-type lectin S-receptor-like serine/threonine-protein kinase At1g61500 isoform X2 [Raphanus sativus]
MDAVQFSVGGELLSIRLAPSELNGNKSKHTIIASTVSIALFVILGFAAFGFWRCRVEHNADISKDEWRNELKPKDVPGLDLFEMNTIQTATNNFSLSNKIGQGGFGSVYKVRKHFFSMLLFLLFSGKLQDGKEIAVKRLSSSSGQGKEEFLNEIIGLLCVQHQPEDRPNTLELLSMLTTTSDLPPPKQPTFVVHTRDDQSMPNVLITVNEMTQSVFLGR